MDLSKIDENVLLGRNKDAWRSIFSWFGRNMDKYEGETESRTQIAVNIRPDFFPPSIPFYAIDITNTSIYSITPLQMNLQMIREVIRLGFKYDKNVWWDATANVGGDTINSIYNWNQLVSPNLVMQANEIDELNFACLEQNIGKFEYRGQTRLLIGNSIELLNNMIDGNFPSGWEEPQIILIDPPWGGRSYKDQEKVELSLGGVGIWELCRKCWQLRGVKLIIVKAPYNVSKRNMNESVKIASELRQKNTVHFFLIPTESRTEKRADVRSVINSIVEKIKTMNMSCLTIKMVPKTLPTTIYTAELPVVGRHFQRFYLHPRSDMDVSQLIGNLIRSGFGSDVESHLSIIPSERLIVLDIYYTLNDQFIRVLSEFMTTFLPYNSVPDTDGSSVSVDKFPLSVRSSVKWSISKRNPSNILLDKPVDEWFTGNTNLLWFKQAEHLNLK